MSARVITEADVRSGDAGDPIVVDAGTTITPSALDAAERLGLDVVWERGGPDAPAARGTARGVDLPVVHLPEGTYTVVVAGGRATITKETSRGPVPLEGR